MEGPLLRLCLAAITSRWSPVRAVAAWHGRVVAAAIREMCDDERPVTWADLNPFAKPRTEPMQRWVNPGDGATP